MSLGKTYAAKALNGYENFLKPKRMVKDIAYWVNHYITKDQEIGKPFVCVNAAIEESSLGERENGLLP